VPTQATSPEEDAAQTVESRAIGGAISHAEEGLYCPKRQGESIVLWMAQKLVGRSWCILWARRKLLSSNSLFC
jgi:hypothetical protein